MKKIKIFLAGTLDNGDSANWQQQVIDAVREQLGEEVIPITPEIKERVLDDDKDGLVLYNPRRDNWAKDATDDEVAEQIHWEQKRLDDSDLIFMSFGDNSVSPISLLELGLYAKDNKLIVFCNPKFWRYVNVRETCKKYKIPMYVNTVDNMVGIMVSVYRARKSYNKSQS